MTYSCQYRKLAVRLAMLKAPGPDPRGMTPCANAPVFSTAVILRSEGQDIEIYTETCEDHERLADSIPGHGRSNRLRQPRPA